MGSGRLNFILGKQHGCEKMMQHRLAGRAGQTLFTKLARLVRPAGIKGRRRATNDVLGAGLVHVGETISIASEAKQSRAARTVWIAWSRSLSSGAHSRDPLAPRNGGEAGLLRRVERFAE
jgi:hypothetical protein